MAQGALPYEYEVSRSASGLTALAGLPAVLDLVTVLGLARSIDQHVQLRKIARGWSDSQQVLSLMLLNLAGGDCGGQAGTVCALPEARPLAGPDRAAA